MPRPVHQAPPTDSANRAARGRVYLPITGVALAALVLFLAADPSWPAHAAGDTGPRHRATLLLDPLLAALTYEHNQQEKVKELPFRIGVLFDAAGAESRRAADAVYAALLEGAALHQFLERRIEVRQVPLVAGPPLAERLSVGLDVLYFAEGLRPAGVRAAVTLTRRLDIISVTAVESYVLRYGVTLAVVFNTEHPLVINYPAALEESACFASRMLKLAKVIGWKPGLPACE